MRILLITQWFDPEPTFKGLVFAKELVRQGNEVEVITGFPNYPGGKLYPGYKLSLIQREVIDGVRLVRLPLYPSHDKSKARRILNYISFFISCIAYGVFFSRKADVIYAYHPPLTVGLAAWVIKIFRRAPVVYDIQDLWPDSLSSTGMVKNPKVLTVINYLCLWLYKQVDKITVLSPGFKELLSERGVATDKIEVVYNWADENSIMLQQTSFTEGFPSGDKFKILFAGNMGVAQDLSVILDAAVILAKTLPDVVFILLGSGVECESLKSKAKNMSLTNVIFLPPVPMEQVGHYLQAADILLVHLKNDPLFKITIPSKTQAYMAAGRPILMGVNGDAAELVRSANCGVAFQPSDVNALCRAINELSQLNQSVLDRMGASGRKHYADYLSLQVGTQKFLNIFKNVRVK